MKQMNFYYNMSLIILILLLIMILVSVAFLTLLERKVLGYIQIRKGPNKLGVIGLIQPFSDAIKLISKEVNLMNSMNFIMYLFSPIMMFLVVMMMWMIYPIWSNNLSLSLSLIYLMCCFSISVYGIMFSGWASNSSYSMLGAVRSLAQSISYEVSLSIIMIIPMLMLDNFNLMNLMEMQKMMWFIFYMWPLSFMFFFSIMAELNRTPFDFSEGESELVSGFNVEYSSVGFILIFLSEYSSILFLSFLFSLFYLGGDYYNLLFYMKILFMTMLVIWIRGTLPRFRYDLLMNLCWLIVLPFSLNYMFYMILFKINF